MGDSLLQVTFNVITRWDNMGNRVVNLNDLLSSNAVPTPPADRFLRLKDVLAMTALSRSELYRRVADGRFPKQHRLSAGIAVWRLSEINQWMDQHVHPY